jgi:acyl-CoA synthetase (AMP-forming)/AMP-acid ligase II
VRTSPRPVKVYTRAVEDVLAGHAGVRTAAVIGVSDDKVGKMALRGLSHDN